MRGPLPQQGVMGFAVWLLTLVWLGPALYGLRAWLSIAWLDLPWVWALHGTANSLGFALAGLLAWSFVRSDRISQP
jgi:hypothetical protein